MSGVKRRGLDSKNPKLGHVGTIVNIFYPLTVFFCWGGGGGGGEGRESRMQLCKSIDQVRKLKMKNIANDTGYHLV